MTYFVLPEIFRSRRGVADQKSAGHAILKHLRECSGAAFGATLYRDLVHFGATECNVDNRYMLFIM
jgi:PII-like signaling protein